MAIAEQLNNLNNDLVVIRMFKNGVMLESITFDDWIKHIKAL